MITGDDAYVAAGSHGDRDRDRDRDTGDGSTGAMPTTDDGDAGDWDRGRPGEGQIFRVGR